MSAQNLFKFNLIPHFEMPLLFAGEANIGLIYSSEKSVGKTTALEILAYGQSCSRKSHPLLISLGNQCTSGTSL